MPVYEFACNACGTPVSIFVRSISSPVTGVCARCGSDDLRRLVSRVAVLRSGDSSFDMGDFDESDPRSMAEWARNMSSQMGGEGGGAEFEDMASRLESGESLDDIGIGSADAGNDDF